MSEPICPNAKLDELREMVEVAARDPIYRLGSHNMHLIADILRQLRDAQAEGRVLERAT